MQIYILPVCGFLIHFLKVSFEKQKFTFLIKSNLSFFYDYCFPCSIKPLPAPKPGKYSLLCSSKGFIVLIFMFMIYFKLIFTSGVRWGLRLIFFHTDVWLFQYPWLQSFPSPFGLPWHLCLRPSVYLISVSAVYSVPSICFLILMPVLHFLDCYSFTYSQSWNQVG